MITLKGKSFTWSPEGLVAFRIKYFADTEDEALFSTPASYRGLGRRGSNGAEWDAGENKWIVDVTFQGLPDGAAPSEELEQFTIQGEWREEPIESFPERASLVSTYGGYIDPSDGRLKFPEALVSKAGSGTGLNGSKKASGKNPMFGVTSYPVLRLVAEHTFVRASAPSGIYSEVGTVVNSLPSGFDEPGGKIWIVDTPTVIKVGNARRVTKRWKDLDALRHIEALQRLIKK